MGFTGFLIAITIVCFLLILAIMVQNPKGGGLSATFGGASSAQFGVQRTNDFMEKATWVLAIIIVSLIFLSVVLTAKPSVQIKDVNAPEKKEAKAPAQSAPQAPVQKPTATK